MSTHLRLPPRRSEAIQILEEIARDPKSATARIQAIRLLEEMRQAEQPPGTLGISMRCPSAAFTEARVIRL